MASDIVKTAASQVLAGIEPASRSKFKFIAVDEDTLRVHLSLGKFPSQKTINTDITYNHGQDLYDIKRYTSTDGMLTYKTEEFSGAFCEDLAGIAGGL